MKLEHHEKYETRGGGSGGVLLDESEDNLTTLRKQLDNLERRKAALSSNRESSHSLNSS